jgi:hypothetical protein
MSKLKIGDKVIVKSTNKVGIIKGREVHEMENNRIAIEYVVKTGEGFQNWNTYGKKELVKVNTNNNVKKTPSLVVDAPNGYKVTLVALTSREDVWNSVDDVFGFYRKGKRLRIGYAIYNPNDKYDEERGLRIAKHRAKKTPFCDIISGFSGEFNTETIESLLSVKGKYIAKNLDEFIH